MTARSKRPICFVFGQPLIEEEKILEAAASQRAVWLV